jgi:hypothetical protein
MTHANNPWFDLQFANLQVAASVVKQLHKNSRHLEAIAKDLGDLRQDPWNGRDLPACISPRAHIVLHRLAMLRVMVLDLHGSTLKPEKNDAGEEPQLLAQRDTAAGRTSHIAANLKRMGTGEIHAQQRCYDALEQHPELLCAYKGVFDPEPWAALLRLSEATSRIAQDARLFLMKAEHCLASHLIAICKVEVAVWRQVTGSLPAKPQMAEVEEDITVTETVVVREQIPKARAAPTRPVTNQRPRRSGK